MSRRRQRAAMRPAFSTDQIFNVAKSALLAIFFPSHDVLPSRQPRPETPRVYPKSSSFFSYFYDAFRKFLKTFAQTSRCANTYFAYRGCRCVSASCPCRSSSCNFDFASGNFAQKRHFTTRGSSDAEDQNRETLTHGDRV